MIGRLYFLLAVTFITIMFGGCDGYHHTIVNLYPDNKPSETVIASSDSQTKRLDVEAFLQDFGSKNNMWCHAYQPDMHSMFCGTSPGINIELHESAAGRLTIRISQFGPWQATKEYLALRESLIHAMTAKFPGSFVSEQR